DCPEGALGLADDLGVEGRVSGHRLPPWARSSYPMQRDHWHVQRWLNQHLASKKAWCDVSLISIKMLAVHLAGAVPHEPMAEGEARPSAARARAALRRHPSPRRCTVGGYLVAVAKMAVARFNISTSWRSMRFSLPRYA